MIAPSLHNMTEICLAWVQSKSSHSMIFMLDVSITRVYLHSSCWSMFLAQVATHVRLLSKWVKVEKIEPNSKQVPIRIISQNLFCDRYKKNVRSKVIMMSLPLFPFYPMLPGMGCNIKISTSVLSANLILKLFSPQRGNIMDLQICRCCS